MDEFIRNFIKEHKDNQHHAIKEAIEMVINIERDFKGWPLKDILRAQLLTIKYFQKCMWIKDGEKMEKERLKFEKKFEQLLFNKSNEELKEIEGKRKL
jgi:hypothetical protein